MLTHYHHPQMSEVSLVGHLKAKIKKKKLTHCWSWIIFLKMVLTLIIPGQFGPINRVIDCRWSLCFTRTMSCCGIPSVMATTSGISASMASTIASAANLGGT